MQEKNYNFSGFWIRISASLIDSLWIMLITFPLLLFVYGKDYFFDQSSNLVKGPEDFLISWVLPAIAIILFWTKKHATPGKLAISAVILDAKTGKPLTIGQSIVRYLGYFLSALPLGLGFIWVAFDSKKQGWHDKLARTIVIRTKNDEKIRSS